MIKAVDCRIIVNEFEPDTRYYDHFWTNTHWKEMNAFIIQAMCWIVPLMLFWRDDFGIK